MNAHDIQQEAERACVRIERLISKVGYIRRQLGNYPPSPRNELKVGSVQPVPSEDTFAGRMEQRLTTIHNYIGDVEAELEGIASFIPDEKGPGTAAMRAA